MSCSKEETWQYQRSFEKTNEHMLKDEKLCDVTFHVGSDKKEEIMAHKFILASRSPVFYAMFCGSLPETSKPVEVPDVEPCVFRELLRFIYTEDFTVDKNNSMALLYCSKKYDIKRLKEACKEFLNTNLSCDNVCTILQHAIQFGEDDLENRCLKFVMKNAEGVLTSDDLLTISKDILKKIIDSDDLYVDELTVYNACKRWAIAQCDVKTDHPSPSCKELRGLLSDIIYSVRFPTMSFQTFAEKVAIEDILTSEEKVFVFQIIAGIDISKIPHPFSFIPRKRTGQTEIIELGRFNSTCMCPWSQGGEPDVLNFNVSIPCRLLGVKLFAPCSKGSVEGEISLQNDTSILASKENLEIKYEISKNHETILFDRPVDVVQKKEYTIYVTLHGCNTFYGSNGQSKVSSGQLEVVFSKNDESKNGTNITDGQIHSVIFAVAREQ